MERITADMIAEKEFSIESKGYNKNEVDSFLDEMVYPEVRKGKDILIVGHGAMNSAIICRVKKLPIAEFWSNGIEQCRLMRLM